MSTQPTKRSRKVNGSLPLTMLTSLAHNHFDFADMEKWSPDDICNYLTDKGFADVAPLFKEQKVSGKVLDHLTNEVVLKEIGVSFLGQRLELVEVFQKLKKLRDDNIWATPKVSVDALISKVAFFSFGLLFSILLVACVAYGGFLFAMPIFAGILTILFFVVFPLQLDKWVPAVHWVRTVNFFSFGLLLSILLVAYVAYRGFLFAMSILAGIFTMLFFFVAFLLQLDKWVSAVHWVLTVLLHDLGWTVMHFICAFVVANWASWWAGYIGHGCVSFSAVLGLALFVLYGVIYHHHRCHHHCPDSKHTSIRR